MFPKTKVTGYKITGQNTIVVSRETIWLPPKNTYKKRGKIKAMSYKSMQRLAYLMNATTVKFRTMITLTYPRVYPKKGALVKKDLQGFKQSLRREFGVEYVWFLEFQERGAPHIHMLTTLDSISRYARHRIAMFWVLALKRSEWWKDAVKNGDLENGGMKEACKVYNVHAHPKTVEYLRSERGAARYVTKYASKASQKSIPDDFIDIGRCWGNSRRVSKGVHSGPTVVADAGALREALALMGREKMALEVEHLPRLVWLPEREEVDE